MFAFRVAEGEELRLVEERHAAALFALIQDNHARLSAWVPWLDRTATLEATRQHVRRRLQRFAEGNGFAAGIWQEGRLVGEIGLDYIDWPNRLTEVGYWLGATFEGRGLVSRACRAVVAHAFGELGLKRVQIRCAVENVRSRAVPERLGFRLEGTLRSAERLADRVVDLVVYGMLAEEWEALRSADS
jgi:ribosomal-protein-serine acetyltransferase